MQKQIIFFSCDFMSLWYEIIYIILLDTLVGKNDTHFLGPGGCSKQVANQRTEK